MNTRVLKYSVWLFQVCVLSENVNKFIEDPSVLSLRKEELPPLLVTCGLSDILIISAPATNNDTQHYLTKPNGDTFQLNLTYDCQKTLRNERSLTKRLEAGVKVISDQYRVYVNDGVSLMGFEGQNMGNEFMVGPLGVNDHGNWVLSGYYKRQSEWVEEFQVITVEIVEIVAANKQTPVLNIGDDFELSFKNPIEELQSCQVTAPRSTFDRFYTRSAHNMLSCGFLIPNITSEDGGWWSIVGVGKIVYEATTFLTIKDRVL